jgi:predicted N-formylglutamate amidohydrolase
LFAHGAHVLATHRGYDPGAVTLARDLARACEAPLVASKISRLLIELNRSPHHPELFSEFTRGLPSATKERIFARYYAPYRERVEAKVRARVAAGCRVVHLSAHSFTPVLDGNTRSADVGLLYDPKRVHERALCQRWSERLAQRIAPLRVRRNYPYRGYDDGLTTFLRRRFAADRYIGIEIEVNQKHVAAGGPAWRALRRHLADSAVEMLGVAFATRPKAAPGARSRLTMEQAL